MRAIWNGAVAFGLVSIPIALVPATERRAVEFRAIHRADSGRVRIRKVCEADGQEVTADEISRAYETSAGLVPVSDADLASLPLPTAHAIEVVAFVPASSIDPLHLGAGAYYLAARGDVAARPYVLLRRALERSSKVAVAKYALRDRERLGLLRVTGDVIALHGLRWPDEIRLATAVPAPPAGAPASEEEIKAALALADALSGQPLSDVHDEYREALEAVIAAKAEHRRLAPARPPPAQVVDLMAALQQSVRDAQEAREGKPAAAQAPAEGKTPVKKAGKRAPARRSRTR